MVRRKRESVYELVEGVRREDGKERERERECVC